MIEWIGAKYFPLRREGIVTLAEGGESIPVTADSMLNSIRNAMREIERTSVPDPIRGATKLLAATNMMDAARSIADAAESPLRPRPLVQRHELIPNGYIVGICGTEAVLIVGPEASPAPPAASE